MSQTERRPSRYEFDRLERNSLNDFKIVYIPETTSTMDLVDGLARFSAKNNREFQPTVVVVDHQTTGIGRGDAGDEKKWQDIPELSMLFSIFIPQDRIKEENLPELSDLIALRECMALRKTGGDFLIKAPNDIVDADTGKKVSGILARGIYAEDGEYLGANVGIGINVHYANNQLADFSTEPEYGATSLDTSTSRINNRLDLLADILTGISTVIPEAGVINTGNPDNPASVHAIQNALWRDHYFFLGKRVRAKEGDVTLAEGKVVETEIGNGFTLRSEDGASHSVQIFGTDTKVRLTA
jgi:biotin-(acetyl-CoA carboxylase) ligase